VLSAKTTKSLSPEVCEQFMRNTGTANHVSSHRQFCNVSYILAVPFFQRGEMLLSEHWTLKKDRKQEYARRITHVGLTEVSNRLIN
jgi:hypothetical protein